MTASSACHPYRMVGRSSAEFSPEPRLLLICNDGCRAGWVLATKKTNSLERPTLSAVSHDNHWLFPHLWMFLIVIPQKTNETAKIMVKSMVTNHSPTISGTTQFRSLLQFVVNESCCFTALTVAAWALGMRLGRKWAKQSIHLWLFYSRDRMFKDIQK